ncbi:MAG: response regulator transcription factor [Planctomycetota bacterium]|jgi:DNA-binding response OmpR family regulator
MTSILLIEDNETFAKGLANNLEIEGHKVEVCHDGVAGLERLQAGGLDLLILDLMLPDMDGFRILSHLRKDDRELPVLILSARGEEMDKVRGFRLGADDYVTKPFGVMEFLARVDALLRRGAQLAGRQEAENGLGFGQVSIDYPSRSVTLAGEELAMTPKEFDLLLALCENRGKVISRYDLLTRVWGQAGNITTRTVDTHIAQLRRKLEKDPARPEHILTVRKVGYRLRD